MMTDLPERAALMQAIPKLQKKIGELHGELNRLREAIEVTEKQRDAYKQRALTAERELRSAHQLFALAVHAAGEIRIAQSDLVSGVIPEIGHRRDDLTVQEVFYKPRG
jgi:predicted  nucleic acid-binding Zn-ribbon protein